MAKWTFQAQPDVFIDIADIHEHYPEGKVTTQPSLGLIPGKSYPSDDLELPDQRDWVRLERYVKWLNEKAPENIKYKVLYMTRHGLGYHNKLHKEVGHEAWEQKWSYEYGNETETWFDAHLTEVGIQQAKDLNAFWKNLTTLEGAPLPSTLYTSPLARCLQTSHYVFRPLLQPFKPIIKENLRERITIHQCDFRRPRSWIAENYPDYVFEEGFAEDDVFAGRKVRETSAEHEKRKQKALEDIWESDEGIFIGLTVHSYAIRAVQVVCGLRRCRTREGTSLALLVKGEKMDEKVVNGE